MYADHRNGGIGKPGQMIMNGYFLAALITMTVVSVAILLVPVLRRARSAEPHSTIPFVLTAILVPALAVGLYASIGSPNAAVANTEVSASLARMNQISNRSSATQKQVNSVSDLLDGLEQRLQSEPDDAGGWLLLAKSHKHLGNRENAASAYARAVALGKTDPDLEAFLSSADNVKSQLSGIQGRVTIADDAAAEVDGSATVFVIARAASGSPVPLAVLRTPVSTLPFEFNLHDGQAMVAGNELSSADSVIITAKISANGDALSTVPGFETHSDPVMTADPGFVILDLGQ
jgi:hypothetical protein